MPHRSEPKPATSANRHVQGLIAAPFSPLSGDGSVNLDLIPKQCAFLRREGVAGAFVCGTTGESMLLTVNERMEIARRWVETAPAGFKIIIHVGHISLQVAETLLAHAREIGAAGAAAMPPSFFKPETLDDLVTYSAELASAAPDLPFYYYHFPEMTGVSFPMVDFLESAKDRIPNLAGIKYTHHDMMDFELCRMVDGGRFDMVFGRDEFLLCGLALGARGAIGTTYNFAAPLYRELIAAFDACDFEKARARQRVAMQLVRALKRTGASFFAAAKAVMRMRGLDCGGVRLPLRDLTKEQYERLEADLDRIGFFTYCPR